MLGPPRFLSSRPRRCGARSVHLAQEASARAKDERRVTALYTEAARLFHAVSSASGFQPRQLPDPANFERDPEACAVTLRRSAGLAPDEPVKNVVRLLERHGIGVVVAPLDDSQTAISDHLGVSRPTSLNDRPLIATVHELPGAVQRLQPRSRGWTLDFRRATSSWRSPAPDHSRRPAHSNSEVLCSFPRS